MIDVVRWCDSPKTIDVIKFELETTNEDGVIANPHSVEKITIYFLQRGPDNLKSYEDKHYDPKIERELNEALEEENRDINKIKFLKKTLEDTAFRHTTFYSDAVLVTHTGTPCWVHNFKKNLFGNLLDKKGKPIPGKFEFIWHPINVESANIEALRSGDYIIQWEWRTKEGGKLHSSYMPFFLKPSNIQNMSVHLKRSPRNKYEFLMDRYLPRMYKHQISNDDLTHDVLKKINKSVAEGFTILEDLATDLFEILDANFTHPLALPLLGNLFNLDLKYNDITLWRRQVKQAVPLFKKKGTLAGLREALEQAGIRLVSLKNLWQVTSKHTWVDSFLIKHDAFDEPNQDYDQTVVGNLTRIPIDTDDIEVYLRAGSNEYINVPSEVATIYLPTEADEKPSLVWNGNKLEEPINLIKGDIVRVKYKYKEIPESEKSIEEYIQSLPLADHRDEIKQEYPRKNWNVHLIEEDDPLFDTVIKERHPFYDPVVFGQIRSIFLFSENVYNMDTYNGSLRNSNIPCNIDKDFIDECSYGRSSKFNVELEIEGLSDDRIEETKEIIREYSPFHALLHQMRVTGKVNDFIMPPNESVTYSIKGDNKNASKDKVDIEENIVYQIRWKDGKTETHVV